MKLLLKLFILTIFTLSLYANNQEVFIKEYTYNASDDDSKNSARKKAIAQLKSLLSEEIGTVIKSTFTIKTDFNDDNLDESINKELTSLSGSYTKLTILDEKWDGSSFYVKAKVIVDKDKSMQLLKELQSQKQIEKQSTVKKDSPIKKIKYVKMLDTQPLYKNGKQVATANESEIFKVMKIKPCKKGEGMCWVLKGVNNEKRGIVRKFALESFHEIYEKE
jgi:hypothetical protein